MVNTLNNLALPMKIFVIYILIINVVSFILYGLDKGVSMAGTRGRIPEFSLMLLAILGGAFASLLAMVLFHHKVSKPLFRFGVPLLIFLNAIIYYAVYVNFIL